MPGVRSGAKLPVALTVSRLDDAIEQGALFCNMLQEHLGKLVR